MQDSHAGQKCLESPTPDFETIEEYRAKRGLSPQIMKIELVSISATESLFLHSVKVS